MAIDFNEAWGKYYKLIFWLDKRLCPIMKMNRGELVGSLTIIFKRCCELYDPSKAKFSTYFVGSSRSLLRQFLMYESEEWRQRVRSKSVQLKRKGLCLEGVFVPNELMTNNIKESWSDEFRALAGNDKKWLRLLLRNMQTRDFRILIDRKYHGKSLREVADKQNPPVSRERIRQIEERALAHAQRIFKRHPEFSQFFPKTTSNGTD